MSNTIKKKEKKEDQYFLVKFPSLKKPAVYRASVLDTYKKPAGRGGTGYLRLNLFNNQYEKPLDIQPISSSVV